MLEAYRKLEIRGVLGEAGWRYILRVLDNESDAASRVFPKRKGQTGFEDQEC
jgi:hypothetical protein